MSTLFSRLQRGLLGIAMVGTLSYGAVEAFASPGDSPKTVSGSCQRTGTLYIPDWCPECDGGSGYCNGYDTECVCFN